MEKVPSLIRNCDKGARLSGTGDGGETKWRISYIVITSEEGGLLLVKCTKVSLGCAGRGNAG